MSQKIWDRFLGLLPDLVGDCNHSLGVLEGKTSRPGLHGHPPDKINA